MVFLTKGEILDCPNKTRGLIALTHWEILLPWQREIRQAIVFFSGAQIRQCFPDILLATMSILYNEYKQTRFVGADRGILGERRENENMLFIKATLFSIDI